MNPKKMRSGMLAFVSGFIDTAAFVHMGGLFVAHVTGNFVLLGAALVGQTEGHDGGTALQLAAFPVFFVGAMLAAVLHARVHRWGTPLLLWLSTALMAACAGLALAGAGSDAIISMVLVLAMGILNAAQRIDPDMGPPFTVMTGNVTGQAIGTAQSLGLSPLKPDEKSAAGGLGLWLVIGFGIGSVAGALAVLQLAYAAILIPATCMALTLLFISRSEE
ncbi:YoaK family protein [Sulfitobacter sp. S190]|uniref:YoaK family protein n=1 Tax=Sulfitobacter sp. S190 TaxID=2867022 RepID=UPI0021A4B99E|nr:YoaK family protein [Sulfitobacter sp. S190]UWR24541.1 DUF1275 domain-containing protein [Sulfitobacter sp. S190]